MESRAWNIGDGPGITALGLAAARAVESTTADRLIEDPYAVWFVEASDVSLPMLTNWPETADAVTSQQALHLHGSRFVGLRTRFYDDWLRDAGESGVHQAVLLGAGLDTRAYRFAWPEGFKLLEIDQPDVFGFKAAVLAERGARPACRHKAVGADLRDDWTGPLIDAGFEPGAATAWLAEGLLAYLPAQAEAEIFNLVDSLSAPGSCVAFDRILGDPAQVDGKRLEQSSERSGVELDTLVSTEQRADTFTWLASHGWSAEQEPVAALADRYGRGLEDPFAAAGARNAEPPWLDSAFVTARRPG